MFSSSRTLRLVVLFSLLVSFVHAHDPHVQSRDHSSIQRMLKKRLPEPQDRSILGPVTASASDDPADGTDTTTGTDSTDTTKDTDTTKSNTKDSDTKDSDATTGTGDKTLPGTNGTLADATGSTTNTTTTAPANNTSFAPVKTEATPLPSDAAADDPSTTVVIQSQTKITTVDQKPTATADRTGASSNSEDTTKSMTMTIVIAVAASVGGIAIIWTIFRKWKLSSSKKFDRRLNPNWTPPADVDDSPLPTHRRRTSGASTRSGYGPSNNGTSLDQDLTAGPAHLTPVGGYADLARGASPNPQMQERHMHRGFDRGAPLHHQGGAYGNNPPFDAYDYNGQGVRY